MELEIMMAHGLREWVLFKYYGRCKWYKHILLLPLIGKYAGAKDMLRIAQSVPVHPTVLCSFPPVFLLLFLYPAIDFPSSKTQCK